MTDENLVAEANSALSTLVSKLNACSQAGLSVEVDVKPFITSTTRYGTRTLTWQSDIKATRVIPITQDTAP